MKKTASTLWKVSLAEAEAEGAGRRRLQMLFTALLPFGIIAAGLYLSYIFYDQSQQEELRRDYLSTYSFRLLPKQISAELDAAQIAILQGNPFEGRLQRARNIGTQLDEILTILSKGGVPSVFTSSSKLWISSVNSPEGRTALKEAFDLYNPMRALLQMLASQEKPDPKQVVAAAELFDARSSRFMPIADIVRSHALDEASDAVHQQQVYLISTMLGTIGLLLVFGFGLYSAQERRRRRLLTSSNEYLAAAGAEVIQAKQETDLILAAVRQGMLLMSEDSTIGEQYSAAMAEIFESRNLAGVKFLNLLQRVLSEKIYLTTRDYFAMLFDLSKKEKLLGKINPLARVEASFPNPNGGFSAKHLEFAFRRIYSADNQSVALVLVTVRDITRQVELEESLKQAEQKKERQFELLLGILHIGPDALKEFLAMVEGELKQINDTLKGDDSTVEAQGPRLTAVLRERLDLVFRSVHNIKGNADFLKLDHFSKAAHAFEDSISELKSRPRLAGDDFLGIAIFQAELRNDLAEVRDLAEKLVGMRHGLALPTAATAAQNPAPLTEEEGEFAAMPVPDLNLHPDPTLDGVRSLAESLAKRLGKEIEVFAPEFDTTALPEEYRRVVRDILIQLTRNTLVHGVEPAAERLALGKPRAATIFIAPAADLEAGYPCGFVYRDDGRGLDPARIRRHAVERGLVSEEYAASMMDSEAATLIFEKGFSTAETITGDAGRGVGLDLVKARVIDEIGGEVYIDSEPGKFCEFTFLLPDPSFTVSLDRLEPAFANA